MAKSLIFQGNGDGYGCECLVDFLAKKKTGCGAGCHCLEPYKPQANLRYLCKKRPIQRTHRPKEKSDVEEQQSREEKNEPLAVEEHFTDVSTKSWKMTAVSLLGIIIHLAPIYAEIDKKHCSASHALPPKAVKDCLEAYSQAWEIIDFVEETGTVADGITSQAADLYFCNLQKKMKDECPLAGKFRHATPECMRAALDDLKMQCKRKTEPHESVNLVTALIGALGEEDKEKNGGDHSNRWTRVGGNDSFDWKAAASGNAVYKLCNSIQCNDGREAVNGLLQELESSLADIINKCLEKSQYLLLLNSKKWARNSDEKMMGKALYTVGKARLIMDKLDMKEKTVVEERKDSAIVPIE